MSNRVLVSDPLCPLDTVREVLGPLPVEVEAVAPPLAGSDVVGVLVAQDVPLAAADLARLPALRVVATTSIGYDHIALEEAQERGIWVCNVPDYCEKRELRVELEPEEFARRLEGSTEPPIRFASGALAKYAALVSSASLGAVTRPPGTNART